MNTNEIVEIVSEAIKKIKQQSHFSSTELMNDLETSVSKQEIETVLKYLQDAGWIERKTGDLSTWETGSTGNAYLSSNTGDSQAFRVLPGEVPDDESIR